MTGPTRAALALLGLLVGSVVIVQVDHLVALLVVLATLWTVALAVRVPLHELVKATRPVLPVLIAVVLAHGFTASWAGAAVVGVRVLVLVTAAALLNATTRTSDLLTVLEGACRPLRPFGIDPTRVALTLTVALRCVPLLGERVTELVQAQRARGIERPGVTLLGPLVISTLRLSDSMADALDARGVADPPAAPARLRRAADRTRQVAPADARSTKPRRTSSKPAARSRKLQ